MVPMSSLGYELLSIVDAILSLVPPEAAGSELGHDFVSWKAHKASARYR